MLDGEEKRFPEINEETRTLFSNQCDYIQYMSVSLSRRQDIIAVVMLMVQMMQSLSDLKNEIIKLQFAYNDMAKKLNENRSRIILP